MIQLTNILNEDLRKWFGKGGEGSTTGGGWDRYNSKGEKAGKCGDSEKGDSYAACLSKEKAAKLGKDGIAAFVKRKRAAQSKAGDSKKGGEQSKGQKPTFVKTGASEGLEEKWSSKYKKSINCSNPKGFSQKAHCAGKKKNESMTIEEKMELFLEKNCPTDSAKWSASKAAAKAKFDVYPSAYANGWAAKNYKGRGGGWKTCSENVVNEVTGKEAKEIAKLTGTRDSIVQKFIDDFNLNAKNLFNFIVKGKEKARKDFATAMSGRPGNKYQGDFVGMFGEGVVNEACWEGYKQVGGKMKNGRMVPNCVPVSEDINSDDDVNYGLVEPEEYDVEDEDMEDFISFMRSYSKQLSEANCNCVYEAEYQGREVKLGKPMQGDVKKFKVYVKNPAGNVVKVNFGQKGMKIRKSNPKARKSFRARMNCDNPGPRHKANYWSCRKW